jgi:hypothetical protein
MWYDGGIKVAKARVGIALRDAMQPNKVKCMDVMKELIKSSKLQSMSIAMIQVSGLQNSVTTLSHATIQPLRSQQHYAVPDPDAIHLHNLFVRSQSTAGARIRRGQGQDHDESPKENPAVQFHFDWSEECDDSIGLVEAGYILQALASDDETYCTKLLEDIDDLNEGYF